MTQLQPEKSTNQLAVWRDLIQALEQVDTAWKAVQALSTGTAASSQLPANLAVALVKTSHQATEAVVGVTDILVDQYDNGDTFRNIASVLRQGLKRWPTR
ncbi:hypothetical protein [Actinokineospora sp. NBRC 105648]|uniref:hypothetical protein n=1 Tax=Actinokineospora sp. NBRC 105648 TaxID=3032206 RepID=UPI0024A499F7|nr:hypothetical protein [Actinokineospora sp. NBRC 105648]GLZ42249.1 hypothetical protein Acsp05_58730 [Actinokineospora sp. NBRC 105648]